MQENVRASLPPSPSQLARCMVRFCSLVEIPEYDRLGSMIKMETVQKQCRETLHQVWAEHPTEGGAPPNDRKAATPPLKNRYRSEYAVRGPHAHRFTVLREKKPRT
jgi:hypothetical protein